MRIHFLAAKQFTLLIDVISVQP